MTTYRERDWTRTNMTQDVEKYFKEEMGWDEPFFVPGTQVKTRNDGCYVVLARPNAIGGFHVADFAGSSVRGPWFCQNDSEELTAKEWKSVRPDPYCDGFTFDEEE